MARVKVRRAKLPFKSLAETEKRSLVEFDRIVIMAARSIHSILEQSQPTYGQHAFQGHHSKSNLDKSIQEELESEIDLKRKRDIERRNKFRAPAEKSNYIIESSQEPLAAVARSMTLEDFITACEQGLSSEEKDWRASAEMRANAKMDFFTEKTNHEIFKGHLPSEAAEIVRVMPGYKALETAERIATAAYAKAHDKWELKRRAVLQATQLSLSYAKQDEAKPVERTPFDFWMAANT